VPMASFARGNAHFGAAGKEHRDQGVPPFAVSFFACPEIS